MDKFLPGAMAVNIADTPEDFVTEVMLQVPRSATGDIPGIKPSEGTALLGEMFRQFNLRVANLRPRGAVGSIQYYREMRPFATDLKDLTAAMTALSILLNRAFLYIESKSAERQGDT